MRLNDTKISLKEQKAIQHLIDVLGMKFQVSSDNVEVNMQRGVPGFVQGRREERDHINVAVNTSGDTNESTLNSLSVQHSLSSELSSIWTSKNIPLVTVQIRGPEAEEYHLADSKFDM